MEDSARTLEDDVTSNNDKPARLCFTLRYSDAPAAIDWLCSAFGFERHMVVAGDDDGKIAHAQLTLGDCMVMLGSKRDDEFGTMQTVPSDLGGRVSASPYIVIADVDAHHEGASAAGAQVTMPPEDQDYGGRLYVCRDPEGHVWSFGSYDPWAEAGD